MRKVMRTREKSKGEKERLVLWLCAAGFGFFFKGKAEKKESSPLISPLPH